MLGDCYTCAIVEYLSKSELQACEETTHTLKSDQNSPQPRDSVSEFVVLSTEKYKKHQKI